MEPCVCTTRHYYKGWEYDVDWIDYSHPDKRRHVFECVDCGEKKYSEWVDYHTPTGITGVNFGVSS